MLPVLLLVRFPRTRHCHEVIQRQLFFVPGAQKSRFPLAWQELNRLWMKQNYWRKTWALSFYTHKPHNSKCRVSTSGCHTSIPDILCPCRHSVLHFKQLQEQKFCSHGSYFFITLLNLILILPSVLWTMAKLCTCGRKLPHTALCKMGQRRVAPQAPVTSKPRRSWRLFIFDNDPCFWYIYLCLSVFPTKKEDGGNPEISPLLASSAFQEGEKVIWKQQVF